MSDQQEQPPLDPDEATALMDQLPESWEKLQASRDDIRDGNTISLAELEQRLHP